jgi:FSR family fosmidomycin resistance protein-like MFS transporter
VNPDPATPSHGFSLKALSIIFLAHFTGDFYQSFFNPLMPLIRANLGISLTQVGILVSTVTLTGYLSQPVMGLLADRHGPRMFMFIGLFVSALVVPLLAVTPWYLALIPLAAMGPLGSAMYHPTMAGSVAHFAGKRSGLSMSIFGLGGTVSYALGPLVLALFVESYGLTKLPFISLFGLASVVAVMILLPHTPRPPVQMGGILPGLRHGLGTAWKPIMLLWLIGSLRSVTDMSIRAFYPILHLEIHGSVVSMGLVLSLFTLGSSASALVCGNLADRHGYKPVFYASYALATPCVIGFLYSSGFWIYPMVFVAGFVLLATMFPSVALANQLAPHNRSLASSLTLGFAVGTGGFMSPLVGQLADYMGIQQTLLILAFAPLICLLLIPMIQEPPGQSDSAAG